MEEAEYSTMHLTQLVNDLINNLEHTLKVTKQTWKDQKIDLLVKRDGRFKRSLIRNHANAREQAKETWNDMIYGLNLYGPLPVSYRKRMDGSEYYTHLYWED